MTNIYEPAAKIADRVAQQFRGLKDGVAAATDIANFIRRLPNPPSDVPVFTADWLFDNSKHADNPVSCWDILAEEINARLSTFRPAPSEPDLKRETYGDGYHDGYNACRNDYGGIGDGVVPVSVKACINAAVLAEREACAAAVEKRAFELGRQECCGRGVGAPPECCCEPLFMISGSEAALAICARTTNPEIVTDGKTHAASSGITASAGHAGDKSPAPFNKIGEADPSPPPKEEALAGSSAAGGSPAPLTGPALYTSVTGDPTHRNGWVDAPGMTETARKAWEAAAVFVMVWGGWK